jgi:pantetheine-phosphate adenylyltransferase
MKTAIYPISADPITNGHIDIIGRALKIFDKVVVAIGNSSQKNYLFNLDERTEITKKVLSNFQNLEVISFDRLLTDVAKERQIKFIVRGFRNAQDYLHEQILYKNYLSQNPDLEFINLFSNEDFISSSTVKELVSLGGEVHQSVPLYVKQMLETKVRDLKLVGVAGNFGAGKNFVSAKLVELGIKKGIEISTIDLDVLGHEVLAKQDENLVWEIEELFGTKIDVDPEKGINRTKLAELVFSDGKKLNSLNNILHPRILHNLRGKLHVAKGLVLLQSAIFVETKLNYLCNNNFILIKAETKEIYKRLLKIGYSEQEVQKRLSFQLSLFDKKRKIEDSIIQTGQGKLWEIENDTLSETNLNDVLDNLIQYFN